MAQELEQAQELSLTELIDVEVLQKLQDAFSDMVGVAALTADRDGTAVTEGSNFTDFCMKYTRSTSEGKWRCEECDRHGAELTMETGRACSYYCHAGLVDFAAPIIADGKMVGSFIGGQILTDPPDMAQVERVALELGIDPEKYKEAISKVRIVDKSSVDRAANLLCVIASVLSNIAYKSYNLHLSNLEVEKSARMKSDFLANMSHEIRTPMNAVLGMADLALREEMSPDAREYIHQIKASGRNLLTIINDILDFSKIESGKMDIIEVGYEPLSVINDLANIVNTRIGNKNIEFIMDISPDLPQMLLGDNIRIQQIMINLLNNAVKFTKEGLIELKMECDQLDEDSLLLKVSVRDTGQGIKKEDIGKLFQSFQQVDSKRNRNIEGTGLGLAITQQLLKLMNGRISVESEYDVGTTFLFELPQKIVRKTQAVPALEKPLNVAIIVENPYVKEQLQKDLMKLGAKYKVLEKEQYIRTLAFDFLLIEEEFLSEEIQNFLFRNPKLQTLVIARYGRNHKYASSNIHVMHKPIYSLGLYSAMGIGEEFSRDTGMEYDEFTFVAPEARILIVDDNLINLTVAEGLLDPLKMQIDSVESAAKAIEKIKQVRYDLIFMDHMMPGVDGVEATHIIRRLMPDYAEVPIIALTANAVSGVKEMFLREGMNDFVAKPIEIKDILSKLRRWLPQEKIVLADKEKLPEPTKQPEEQQGEKLEIEDLNVDEAMRRLGSEKLFRAVLKEYFVTIDKKYDIIETYWKNERWKNYTIEVHALKSSSRQIGAEGLAELAAELEKAGNEENIALIQEKTEELLREYRRYQGILEPYFPECAKKQEEASTDAKVVHKLLNQMGEALDNFDTLQMDEVLEEMSHYKYTGLEADFFAKLKEAASDSDIDACVQVVEDWRTKISP